MPATATKPPPSATKGPRRNIRVRIAYQGKAPGPLLADKYGKIEDLLLADNAGTVLRTEGTGGAVDIYVVTADVERTTEILWQHVNALGLASRTTIHREHVDSRRG